MNRATLTIHAVFDPTVTPRALIASAFTALLAQGAYGRDPNPDGLAVCQYRVPGTADDLTAPPGAGLACVVGQLIPDDEYIEDVEGAAPSDALEWITGRYIGDAANREDASHKVKLLSAAQKVHDNAAKHDPTAANMRASLLRACDPAFNADLRRALDYGDLDRGHIAEVRAVLESLP